MEQQVNPGEPGGERPEARPGTLALRMTFLSRLEPAEGCLRTYQHSPFHQARLRDGEGGCPDTLPGVEGIKPLSRGAKCELR